MDISGKPVLFHLSPQGRRALGTLVPRKGAFRALVLAIDNTGASVLFPGVGGENSGDRVPVMLLKWDYISTVVFDFKPEHPRPRPVPGFVKA
jgi:hypothetical protein